MSHYLPGRGPRVPPLPNRTALTDRVDGTLYEIVKTGSSPALSSISEAGRTHYLYGAYDGPTVIDDAGVRQRLFSSSGVLSFERSSVAMDQALPVALVSSAPLDVWYVTISGGVLGITELV